MTHGIKRCYHNLPVDGGSMLYCSRENSGVTSLSLHATLTTSDPTAVSRSTVLTRGDGVEQTGGLSLTSKTIIITVAVLDRAVGVASDA